MIQSHEGDHPRCQPWPVLAGANEKGTAIRSCVGGQCMTRRRLKRSLMSTTQISSGARTNSKTIAMDSGLINNLPRTPAKLPADYLGGNRVKYWLRALITQLKACACSAVFTVSLMCYLSVSSMSHSYLASTTPAQPSTLETLHAQPAPRRCTATVRQ